jgi:myo-inositol-1(or 4)-monophosphatase
MTDIDPIDLLFIARDIAEEAAALAADMRNRGVRVRSTKSNELDIVTQADTAVEALIRSRILAIRPSDGVLGEESGEETGSSDITWVVDPIDGTVNYLYGSSNYAVSIAATATTPERRRIALAGCVYAPALSLRYEAALGHPAYRNGEELGVNRGVPLHKALISFGIPYSLSARSQVLGDVTALTPQVRDLRLSGSAALDLCGVAEGRTDAHVGRQLPIWDYAAAGLIASQAGAVVRGLRGQSPSLDLVLVADPPLADAIEPLLTNGEHND